MAGTVSTTMIVQIVLLVVLVVLVLLGLGVLRRLQQLRRGGVDVALRPSDVGAGPDDERGWHTGIARYRGNEFRWFRISGLRSVPNVVLDRTDVEIVDRRPARPDELHGETSTVLLCRTRAGTWEIAMDPDVLTGFSSWLESTPPGRSTGYRQAS